MENKKQETTVICIIIVLTIVTIWYYSCLKSSHSHLLYYFFFLLDKCFIYYQYIYSVVSKDYRGGLFSDHAIVKCCSRLILKNQNLLTIL